MSIPGQCASTPRRVLWLGALMLLLAGIVGMHGMNGHVFPMVRMAPATGTHLTHTAVSVVDDAAAGFRDTARTAVGVARAVAARTPDGPVGGGHADMTAMCLAVLALALTALARMLGRALLFPAPPHPFSSGRAATPPGRDRDPPSLARLSVRRC